MVVFITFFYNKSENRFLLAQIQGEKWRGGAVMEKPENFFLFVGGEKLCLSRKKWRHSVTI